MARCSWRAAPSTAKSGGGQGQRLGVEEQVRYNRSAPLIRPAGVTQGAGVEAEPAERDRSPPSTRGMGDAENDQALLDWATVDEIAGGARGWE